MRKGRFLHRSSSGDAVSVRGPSCVCGFRLLREEGFEENGLFARCHWLRASIVRGQEESA